MKTKLSIFVLTIASILLTSCGLIKGKTSSSTSSYSPITKTELDYSTHDLMNDGNNIYNIDSYSDEVSPHILIIPILFSDSSLYISDSNLSKIRNDIEIAFFGSETETGWNSVRTFYEKESFGKITITGEVTKWYSFDIHSSQVTEVMTESILDLSIEHWKETKTKEEIKQFDRDNNGWLDGVIMIYGVPDVNAGYSSNENLWAYTSWLQDPNTKNVENPGPNMFMWASYDFLYYDTDHVNVDTHTLIHESGHMFGLEDYYDYNPRSAKKPAGGFNMQDFNVGMHDPFSLMENGWVKPYVPTSSCTIQINPFTTSGDLILLSPEFKNSPFDEYILIELYTPNGLNELDCKYRYLKSYPIGPSSYGIRLWHVDARLLCPSGIQNHQYVYQDNPKYISTEISYNPYAVSKYGYTLLCSNTSYHSSVVGYCSPLGKVNSKYYNYRLLDLIRADDKNGDRKTNYITNSDLFKSGNSFSFDEYKNNFYNIDSLNNGKTFNWKISFDSVTPDCATITVTI